MQDHSVVSVKTEVLIRAPVTQILRVIKEHQWSPQGNPQNIGIEAISNSGHYEGNCRFFFSIFI